ncbi:MAG: hypothetical protein M4D80_38500 [Myxococcota bacterium]|nr:hypothetical protein [Deltaproteobacteria bacterium]MDQ3341085.1 hypothetical protein [Myxococcota bacterium]
MLGKLVGPRQVTCGLLVLFGLSCAHNVPQDKKTGNDGKTKGAKELRLENGEAKASGIVTYPGGDRVDWKVIEIPDKQRGTLDIKLQWTPPRPGLQLAFDVFDEWNTPLTQSKKTGRKKKSGRNRTAQLEVKGKGMSAGEGKYFIRVYAPNRGDAGKYKLVVEFKPEIIGPAFDPLKLEIPEPPKLAAVPDVEIGCDEEKFDKNIPACKSVCPAFGAPPGWPACKGKCPDPPDKENPACWATMECPKPPDRRIRKCKASVFPKCADIANPDPDNPNCDNAKADPVKARVIGNSVQGSDTVIVISAGKKQGVKVDWKGSVLRGDSDSPMVGGEVTITSVGETRTTARTKLTTDQVGANPYVKLSPP